MMQSSAGFPTRPVSVRKGSTDSLDDDMDLLIERDHQEHQKTLQVAAISKPPSNTDVNDNVNNVAFEESTTDRHKSEIQDGRSSSLDNPAPTESSPIQYLDGSEGPDSVKSSAETSASTVSQETNDQTYQQMSTDANSSSTNANVERTDSPQENRDQTEQLFSSENEGPASVDSVQPFSPDSGEEYVPSGHSSSKPEVPQETQNDQSTDTVVNNNIKQDNTSDKSAEATDQRAEATDQQGAAVRPTADQSDPYEMTEDQKMAMQELQDMRLDLTGEDYPPPPEYNVSERVRQLNEELRNDPDPDPERERTIQFKDNLVDLYAPPPDYSDEEEEVEEDSARSNEQNTSNFQNGDSNNPQGNSSPRNPSNGDKVLVEKDGKFYYMSASECEAQGLMFGLPQPATDDESSGRQPRPPSYPRPSTATGVTGRGSRPPARQQRAQSAQERSVSPGGFDARNFQYTSPYGLSEDEKKRGRRNQQARDEQQRKAKQQEQENEKQKQQDCDDAFQAWLRKKQLQVAQQRVYERNCKKEQDAQNAEQVCNTSDQSVVDEDDTERDPQGSYDSWCQVKREQQRKERDTERKKTKEQQDAVITHSQDENRRAFRQWLKKKNQEARKSRQDYREKHRLTKLLTRRSRKSQQLVSAIRQSQAFRYVDYYGYRY